MVSYKFYYLEVLTSLEDKNTVPFEPFGQKSRLPYGFSSKKVERICVPPHSFFFFFLILFIYLFLVVLPPHSFLPFG